MKFLRYASAAVLGLASLSAQADIYTYTGNLFTFDSINATPDRVVARFEFDFDHSYLAAYDVYEFKSWDITAGSLHLSSANADSLSNRFTLDGAKNITGWYFDGYNATSDAIVQSISRDYSFFAPNDAHDIVLQFGPLNSVNSASNYNSQGSWVRAASPVPEPSSYALLGLGLAMIAGVRRRQKKLGA